MDYINMVVDAIAKTGSGVSKKAKDTTELARLKSRILANENAVKTIYAEIGKYVYENLREDAPAEIAEKMEKIDALTEEMAKNRESILALKGIQKCSQCEKEVSADVVFCPHCGNKMPEPVVDVVDEGDVTEVKEESAQACEAGEEVCEKEAENATE